MRKRKEIEDGISWNGINWNRLGSPYPDDKNLAVNLNFESVMQNQGLTVEVLLDIRDLLSKGAADASKEEK